MSAVITAISRLSTGWSFAWSGAASVDVYLRGVPYMRGVTTSPVLVEDGEENGCPYVTIQDANTAPPFGCPYITLQWYAVDGVDGYRVYEVDGVTLTLAADGAIPALATDGYVTWQSPMLANRTVKTYAVKANRAGVESTVLQKTATVYCNPSYIFATYSVATVGGVTTLTVDEDPYAALR